ncbi:MAG: hypothetical protein H6509_14480 [Bryobacterales bacterium]|nr:hypothetical protein [Acidobacteriota bacterium]MCB9385818.1 hypothetical protein [Bryobacterales bacterium]
MKDTGGHGGLALGLTAACLATGAAGATGNAALLGIASMAVIVLTLAFGWRSNLSGSILWSLAGIYALFSALIAAVVWLENPTSPPQLWLGLPRSTAVLVYGIWPLQMLPCLLFALRFRDAVLPPDKLERFLAEHSRHRKTTAR